MNRANTKYREGKIMTGEITISSGKNSSTRNALPSVKGIRLKQSRQTEFWRLRRKSSDVFENFRLVSWGREKYFL